MEFCTEILIYNENFVVLASRRNRANDPNDKPNLYKTRKSLERWKRQTQKDHDIVVSNPVAETVSARQRALQIILDFADKSSKRNIIN